MNLTNVYDNKAEDNIIIEHNVTKTGILLNKIRTKGHLGKLFQFALESSKHQFNAMDSLLIASRWTTIYYYIVQWRVHLS